jgi:hypothetical protein
LVSVSVWPISIGLVSGLAKKGKNQTKPNFPDTKQQALDFKTVTGPCEFMWGGVLHAVASLIATNNQASSQYT